MNFLLELNIDSSSYWLGNLGKLPDLSVPQFIYMMNILMLNSSMGLLHELNELTQVMHLKQYLST